METWDCIKGRRSIRSFDSTPVKEEDIYKILEAGVAAPNAGNLQAWRFVVVRDRAKKIELAEAAVSQMWMVDAPVVIVVCIDTSKHESRYGSRGKNLYALQDTAACVENMLLMIHDLGYASCWVGSFSEPEVVRICKLPDKVRPVAMVPVGKGTEKPPMPTRMEMHNIAFVEQYGKRWVKDWQKLHGP
jgi:nitroreductase